MQIMKSGHPSCIFDETKELPRDADAKAQPASLVQKKGGGTTSKETRGMSCHDFLKELVCRVRQRTNGRAVLYVLYPTSSALKTGKRPVRL